MKDIGRLIQHIASGGRELLDWLGCCEIILGKPASV